jgi:hypothetical protein
MKSTKINTLNVSATVLNQLLVKAQTYNDLKDDFDALRPSDTTLNVDTISEVSAGNGVVIDSVTLKDGKILTTTAPVSYLLPVMGVGVYGTPVSDAVAIDNIAFTVNMRAGLDKTDPLASSMAGYFGAGNTATTATPNACLQGILVTNTIANSCYSAYGIQANLTSTAIGEVNASGMMIAVAGSITLAHANGTGCIAPGYFIIQDGAGGPFTPAATVYGVWIDIIGTVINSGLIIAGTGSVTAAINVSISGATTYLLKCGGASGKNGATIGSTMHHSPETVAEDGFLTILVNNTAYDIPFYEHA